MSLKLSVIIPAHNPDAGRLGRTLAGLSAQSLPIPSWEAIVVDNASASPIALPDAPPNLRVVREEQLGLTAARLRGFAEAQGELLVLVDDDNVLAGDYLERSAAAFAAEPNLGAAGGRSLPEFAVQTPPWMREFDGLLALRDPGPEARRAVWTADQPRAYPGCAPIGAGMVLRASAAAAYVLALEREPGRRAFDRTGSRLVSGGDNDLVMTILEAGFVVGYLPELTLTHLIPARRTEPSYLGALNRAIARSWVGVLALHGIRLWPGISRPSVPLRQARAWWRSRAWRGPAEWVRWQGLCGSFEGRADLSA